MEKAGILTHWWSVHNYGQKLQAFALEEYLKENGISPVLIKYRWENPWWYIHLPYRRLCFLLSHAQTVVGRKKNWTSRKLEHFSAAQLNITKIKTNYRALSQACNDLELLITGSDQVWRSGMYYDSKRKIHYDAMDAFTLSMPCKATKISYAASAGHYFPPKSYEDDFLSRVRKLDLVSVREKRLAEYLSGHGIPCQVVPDPVFLLSRNRFIDFALKDYQNPYFRKKCFYYALSWDSYISINDVIDFLNNKYQGEYTHVSGNNTDRVAATDYPSVAQWLSYVGNSELVITNSFHCVAFAVIFHTNFFYIPLLPENGENDDRITTLLEHTGIKNRDVRSVEELDAKISLNEKIDWNSVDEKLREYSQVGKDFLQKAFSLMRAEK